MISISYVNVCTIYYMSLILLLFSFPTRRSSDLKIFFGQSVHVIGSNIADHENGGVFGAVKPIEELKRIFVLIGHVDDVFKESDRGVPVGMLCERGGTHFLVYLHIGAGEIFGVLAFYRPRLRLKMLEGVLQVHKPVGL